MIQIPLPTYWRERERERYLKENVYPFGKEIHKKMYIHLVKKYIRKCLIISSKSMKILSAWFQVERKKKVKIIFVLEIFLHHKFQNL